MSTEPTPGGEGPADYRGMLIQTLEGEVCSLQARVQELEREVARLKCATGCRLCSREHEADCDLAFVTCTCTALT